MSRIEPYVTGCGLYVYTQRFARCGRGSLSAHNAWAGENVPHSHARAAAPAKPYFIGVGGGTASGKTRLARSAQSSSDSQFSCSISLCKVIVSQIDARSVVLLSLDSFYKPLNQMAPGEDGKLNFDVPQAFDLPLILTTMDLLVVKRQRCRIPVYDFVTSSRVGDEEVEPVSVVVSLVMRVFISCVITSAWGC